MLCYAMLRYAMLCYARVVLEPSKYFGLHQNASARRATDVSIIVFGARASVQELVEGNYWGMSPAKRVSLNKRVGNHLLFQ